MKRYKDILRRYQLKPKKYQLKGKAMIVDTDDGKYVLKTKERNVNNNIYNYLQTRSFDYYPEIISPNEEEFEVTKYEDEINMPTEQKMNDLINLVGLLHNKTTHYVEVSEDEFKKFYEDISNNIEYLYNYYNDIATLIESKVYMSPSEYLFIRNISKIYAALNFCKSEIETWYKMVKDKRKNRYVVIHNNLNVEHFIRNRNSYLISWDKARIDIPIFDIYKLYKKHALDYEFSEILKNYERSYPLLEEEKKLLFILMALPDKIDFDKRECDLCRDISKKIDLIYKTDIIISPYYTKNEIN